MPASPKRRASTRPWLRRLLALALAPAAIALLSAATPPGGDVIGATATVANVPPSPPSPRPSTPTPSPTPTPPPSPTPSPTPGPTSSPTPSPTPTATPTPTPPPPAGELQVTKVDASRQPVTTPGFTFNIRVGSTAGQVIATIGTDRSGTALAGALNPATYCVEEVSAPEGYQVAPTYSPSACVEVASDPTQGHGSTVVTVVDPPAATPPAAAGAASTAAPTPPATPGQPGPEPRSLQVAALAVGLVGVGGLLAVVGMVMIVLAIRRRRLAADLASDRWYDSTIP